MFSLETLVPPTVQERNIRSTVTYERVLRSCPRIDPRTSVTQIIILIKRNLSHPAAEDGQGPQAGLLPRLIRIQTGLTESSSSSFLFLS